MLWQFFIKRHNSISPILSIVFAINGIYPKTTKCSHRQPCRLSIIRPSMTISALPGACVYSTHCTKYIVFCIKISITGNYILDFLTVYMWHWIWCASNHMRLRVWTLVLNFCFVSSHIISCPPLDRSKIKISQLTGQYQFWPLDKGSGNK